LVAAIYYGTKQKKQKKQIRMMKDKEEYLAQPRPPQNQMMRGMMIIIKYLIKQKIR